MFTAYLYNALLVGASQAGPAAASTTNEALTLNTENADVEG
jgi:hypothetical protein